MERSKVMLLLEEKSTGATCGSGMGSGVGLLTVLSYVALRVATAEMAGY